MINARRFTAFTFFLLVLALFLPLRAADAAVPTVSGFWPGAGITNATVFVFGSGFVPGSGGTTVKVNGINAPIMQVLSYDLLFLLLPAGNTNGPITVTTAQGTATSVDAFGTPLTGVQITGLWPAQGPVNTIAFVFGSGFVPNQTQVRVNQTPAPIMQVLDQGLLFVMVPPGATTGPISVTTAQGSATSAANFVVVGGTSSVTLAPTSLSIATSTTGSTTLSGNDGNSAKTFVWSIPTGLGVTPGAATNTTSTLTPTSIAIQTKGLGTFSAQIVLSSNVPGAYVLTNTQADIALSTRDVTVNVTGASVQSATLAPTNLAIGISSIGTASLSGNDGLFAKSFSWSIPSGLKVTAGSAVNATYSIGTSSVTIRTEGKGAFSAPMLISATRTGSFTLVSSRADIPLNPSNIGVTVTLAPPGPQTRSFTLRLAEASWTLRPNMTQAGFWLIGGTFPGTEIRVNQGDTVAITFINNHTQPHALKFRNGLTVVGDGVTVPAGGSYNYQFTANLPGTYYYTGENDIAIDRGMYGAIVIKSPNEPPVYHDMVHFWDEIPRDWANVNHSFPTYATHEFVINGKTMDSKISGNNVITNAPHGKVGQRTLVRLISIGAHTHAPHLHGHLNDITEGNDPLGVQIPTDVAISPPGSVQHHYINARAAGTWMYHCHVETHLLNNPDGEYPGGMFTHVEVAP